MTTAPHQGRDQPTADDARRESALLAVQVGTTQPECDRLALSIEAGQGNSRLSAPDGLYQPAERGGNVRFSAPDGLCQPAERLDHLSGNANNLSSGLSERQPQGHKRDNGDQGYKCVGHPGRLQGFFHGLGGLIGLRLGFLCGLIGFCRSTGSRRVGTTRDSHARSGVLRKRNPAQFGLSTQCSNGFVDMRSPVRILRIPAGSCGVDTNDPPAGIEERPAAVPFIDPGAVLDDGDIPGRLRTVKYATDPSRRDCGIQGERPHVGHPRIPYGAHDGGFLQLPGEKCGSREVQARHLDDSQVLSRRFPQNHFRRLWFCGEFGNNEQATTAFNHVVIGQDVTVVGDDRPRPRTDDRLAIIIKLMRHIDDAHHALLDLAQLAPLGSVQRTGPDGQPGNQNPTYHVALHVSAHSPAYVER